MESKPPGQVKQQNAVKVTSRVQLEINFKQISKPLTNNAGTCGKLHSKCGASKYTNASTIMKLQIQFT